jgi:hypothetical protein
MYKEEELGAIVNRVAVVFRQELDVGARTTLLFMVEFFQQLMALKAENQMGAQNVAIVIGPLLMRASDDAPPDIDQIQAGNAFVEWLVQQPVAQLQ